MAICPHCKLSGGGGIITSQQDSTLLKCIMCGRSFKLVPTRAEPRRLELVDGSRLFDREFDIHHGARVQGMPR